MVVQLQQRPRQGTRVGAVLQIETLADEMEQVATALQPLVDQALHEIGMLPYNGPAVDFNSSVGPATTPEALAVAAFGGRARVARSFQRDDRAVVLVLADTEPSSSVQHAAWWVQAHRDPEGWVVVGSSNGGGGWLGHASRVPPRPRVQAGRRAESSTAKPRLRSR